MMLLILNSIYSGWVSEYKFSPNRKWRFDFANISLMVAVEIEGGVWINGRHTRGAGYIADMEKYNQAQIEGWRVLRYTPQQENKIIQDIIKIIKKNEKNT